MRMADEKFALGKRRIEIDLEVEIENEPNDEKFQSNRLLKTKKFKESDWEPESKENSSSGSDLEAIINRFYAAGEEPPEALIASRPITYEEAVARMRGEAFETPEEVQISLDIESGRDVRLGGEELAEMFSESLDWDSVRNSIRAAQERHGEAMRDGAAELGRTLRGLGNTSRDGARALRQMAGAFAQVSTQTGRFSAQAEQVQQQMGRSLRLNPGEIRVENPPRGVFPRNFIIDDSLDALRYATEGIARRRETPQWITGDFEEFARQVNIQIDQDFFSHETRLRMEHTPSRLVREDILSPNHGVEFNWNIPEERIRAFSDPLRAFHHECMQIRGRRPFREECRINTWREPGSSDRVNIRVIHEPTGRRQSGNVAVFQGGVERADLDYIVEQRTEQLIELLEERVESLGDRARTNRGRRE